MSLERAQRLIPVARDLVFLAGGMYVFISEAISEARWGPMLLGILAAAGPAVVSAYWSSGRTQDSGSSASPPSPPQSPSPPSPLPSTSAGEP